VNLDSFRTNDVIAGDGDDVFSIEFRNDWEASVARQAAELSAGGQDRSVARRVLARGLAAVSRGSAASVRRLDHDVADDLRQALVTGR
jgi:hypothetical protein